MSFLSSIFAPGEQERSDDLDRRRAELEQTRYERGLITAGERDANQAAITSQHLEVDKEIDGAFNEGLKEGYDNVTGGISSTLSAPFKFIWDAVPWQVWLAGAVALFVWMGGMTILKGRLSK